MTITHDNNDKDDDDDDDNDNRVDNNTIMMTMPMAQTNRMMRG
jgi:hypothetical protein